MHFVALSPSLLQSVTISQLFFFFFFYFMTFTIETSDQLFWRMGSPLGSSNVF